MMDLVERVVGGWVVKGRLKRILETINAGLERSLTEEFPPVPIIRTTQIVGYDEKSQVEESLDIDFSDPVQSQRATKIARTVEQALNSESYPYMRSVYEYLKDMTRSRYE